MAASIARWSGGRFLALRLGPGEDLKAALLKIAREEKLRAAAMVTCVGSLTTATLRMASADRDHPDELKHFDERLEIVSLVGTIGAPDGGPATCHLHLSASTADGRVFGGHVVEGCFVFTTAEIVLVELEDVAFARALDGATGYPELCIQPILLGINACTAEGGQLKVAVRARL